MFKLFFVLLCFVNLAVCSEAKFVYNVDGFIDTDRNSARLHLSATRISPDQETVYTDIDSHTFSRENAKILSGIFSQLKIGMLNPKNTLCQTFMQDIFGQAITKLPSENFQIKGDVGNDPMPQSVCTKMWQEAIQIFSRRS